MKSSNLGVIPITALATLILTLAVLDIRTVFEPAYLLPILNTAFLFLIPMFVAYVSARIFLAVGYPTILLLGCGVLALGLGGLISGWLIGTLGGVNATITIYNTGALFSSCIHASCAVLSLLAAGWHPWNHRKRVLATAYSCVTLILCILFFAVVKGLTPPFILQSTGPTITDRIVLGISVLLFAVSSTVSFKHYSERGAGLVRWYAMGLGLIAIGLCGVFLQKAVGSPIGWAGRVSQYAGGVYILIGVWGFSRAVIRKDIPIEAAVTSIFQEAEANYKALVETASDAIVSIDAGGRVLLWNRAAESLFEYGVKDAVGSPLKELIFPDTYPAGLESPPCVVAAEVKTRGGRIIPAEISVSRRVGSSGAITTFIIKDITERKQAEEALTVSEARMHGVLDATQESIWMFSPDGVILLANRMALARMGRTAQETIGKRFQEVLPPDLAKARLERLREVFESGRPVEFEDERAGLRFNHTFYPVLDSAGRVTSVVSFSRDITERKRAEEALRQAVDRLEMAQSAAKAGTWDWDVISGNTEWSRHMFDLFGLDPLRDSASFETWRAVLHPDDLEMAEQKIEKALKERTALNSDFRVILPSGGIRWINAVGRGEYDDQGRPIRMVGICIDISERKQMEDTLRVMQMRTSTILGGIADTFYSVDDQWRLKIVNPAAEKAPFGRPAAELLGKVIWELYPGLLGTRIHRHYLHAAEKQSLEHYVAQSPLNGRWYEVFMQGWEGGVDVYMRDITERKQAEEALQKAHATLKDHARKLEETNTELEGFSYTISHDLRAPLRAINGFARMLADDYGHSLEEEARRRLGVIESNAVRMGLLIEDLLAFSRAGRNAMNVTRIDMDKLVADVVAALKTSVEGFEGDIQVSPLPPAQGDPAIIRQVIVNLLENAVKFSAKRPDPRIEVGSFVREGEQVYFVKDNGVGFDMKYYNKLFGVFQRLVTEKEFAGTGVGLAIVRRLVNRHGGRVWAEGMVNDGATFFFSLPGKDGHS